MDHLFILLAFFFSLGLLFFTFNRGFTYHDEGYIVQAAERTLHGEIPYRDFHFIYTPITLYLTLLAFKLFGISIFSERLLLLIFSFVTVGMLWKLSAKLFHNSSFIILT